MSCGARFRRRCGGHRAGGGGTDTDPFSGSGDLTSPWIKLNFSVNWSVYGMSGGVCVLNCNNNGILTPRGYYRPIISGDPWTIELPISAGTPGTTLEGVGFYVLESSTGKSLEFIGGHEYITSGGYDIILRNQAGATVASAAGVGGWPTALRLRHNGTNFEFSYNMGSGWTLLTTRAITTDFTSAPDYFGFVQLNWTSNFNTSFDIWNRIE